MRKLQMLFRAFLKLNTYIKKTLFIYRRPFTTYQELDSCKPQMQWCWDLEFFGPSHPHSNRFGYRSRLFKPISFFLDFGLRFRQAKKGQNLLKTCGWADGLRLETSLCSIGPILSSGGRNIKCNNFWPSFPWRATLDTKKFFFV